MKGHNMVDNIKNDTIWNAAKEKMRSAGSISITVLAQAVSGAAASFANTLFTNQ